MDIALSESNFHIFRMLFVLDAVNAQLPL